MIAETAFRQHIPAPVLIAMEAELIAEPSESEGQLEEHVWRKTPSFG